MVSVHSKVQNCKVLSNHVFLRESIAPFICGRGGCLVVPPQFAVIMEGDNSLRRPVTEANRRSLLAAQWQRFSPHSGGSSQGMGDRRLSEGRFSGLLRPVTSLHRRFVGYSIPDSAQKNQPVASEDILSSNLTLLYTSSAASVH